MNHSSSKQLKRTHSSRSVTSLSPNQNVEPSIAYSSYTTPAPVLLGSHTLATASTTATTATALAQEMQRGRIGIPLSHQAARSNLPYNQLRVSRVSTNPPSHLGPYPVSTSRNHGINRRRSPSNRRSTPLAWSFNTKPAVALDPATMDKEPDPVAIGQIKALVPVIPRMMNGEADVAKMIERLARGLPSPAAPAPPSTPIQGSSTRTPAQVSVKGLRDVATSSVSAAQAVGLGVQQSSVFEEGSDADESAGAEFDLLFNALSEGGYVK